ncbi:head decoration protein [Glutamicibacter halophytocola]|uniref:Head decoration protein n=1 Tax=Glutamicibacter halophytocola TaxID=1933880 RepID=A0AA94XYB2_9MICC|nr:head decoration protein [Glutamicibacter halophytocola]UUX60167.1 head decoration protein [Glutamicibacter halophytocola]
MDLSIKRSSVGNENQSWLGSAHGTNAAQSITLDASTFTKATHYPDGYLKSGLPLMDLGNGKYGLHTGPGATPEETPDLAGFLFTTTRAPQDPATPIGAALFEHGRVKVANLPVTIDPAVQATAAGRIIFA